MVGALDTGTVLGYRSGAPLSNLRGREHQKRLVGLKLNNIYRQTSNSEIRCTPVASIFSCHAREKLLY